VADGIPAVKNISGTYSCARDLAVVMPTLNAAARIGAALAALGPVRGIVVADGGSADGTPEIALAAGGRVVAAPRGRGTQIAAAIDAADGAEWLLILHADTVLDPDWRAAAEAHMNAAPDKAACFRFALDSDAPQARRLERAVAWRTRALGLPYGDQGLLVRAAVLRAIGGVKPIPLMEDVDLVRRLGRRRIAALDARAVTSADKWRRDGWTRRSARNLCCLALWFLGVAPHRIARLYS
jgi:rSAM/selenodomain-associated transferase 2